MTGKISVGKLVGVALSGVLLVGSVSVASAQGSGQPNSDWQQNSNWQQSNHYDWQRTNPQAMRATHALNMLEAQGYGDFSHFRRAGDNFTADVMKDGRAMQVLINPGTNVIQPAANGTT
jgi:hypothetical protein